MAILLKWTITYLLAELIFNHKQVANITHVLLNEINKLSMLRILESGWYLRMAFRSWDLYEFPLLRRMHQTFIVKTATQLEKQRYIIFALQTGRKNIMSENTSWFDHCKLNNVKLYLNSECYPYDDMNLDFEKNR